MAKDGFDFIDMLFSKKPVHGVERVWRGGFLLLSGLGLVLLLLLGLTHLGWLHSPVWFERLMMLLAPLFLGVGAAGLVFQRMQALSREAEVYRIESSFFHENRAVMLLIDQETGRIEDANPAAANFYGYSREQLLKMTMTQIDSLPLEEIIERIGLAMDQRQASFTLDHRLASGEKRTVEVFCGVTKIDGRPKSFCVVYDITNRIQTEATLRDSRRTFEVALENIRLAAGMLNIDGRVTFCNDYFANLVGWPKEEIIGRNFLEKFAPASEREERNKFLNEIIFGNRPAYYTQTSVLTRSGKLLHFAWNAFPLRIDGRLEGMAAIGEDITEQRQAANENDEHARELTEIQRAGHYITSSVELSQVLDGLASAARLLLNCRCAAILLHDPDSCELVFTAIKCADQVDDTAFSVIHQPGERIPANYGIQGQVIAGGKLVVSTGGNPSHPGMHVGAPGNGLIAAAPLFYQSDLLGVFLVEQAIGSVFTERQSAILNVLADLAAVAIINHRLVENERQNVIRLKESQEQLIHSERLNVMGRLVAFLTHEINNPLQSLRAGMDLLLEASLPPQKQRQYIEIASREVDRLSHIVERVLGINRYSTDLKARVHIQLVLVEVVMLLETQLERKNIQLDLQYAPDLPNVEGYFDQLHQVFLNLLLNAISVMGQGGKILLRTEWDVQTAQVRVIVQDSGPGIDPEVLPHIFEPFYTTRMNGTGLGLSVCKNIIETHHGQIEVQSQPGRGATFILSFPAILD